MVTGGAGFIGSHLVDKLLGSNNTVIVYDVFDNFYAGKDQNIRHNLKNRRYKLVRDDILNFETLLSIMKNVDVVFHDAAQCGVRYCIENPKKGHNVNVTGTLNVLIAAKKANVKKVVYASSSGIFGLPYYMPMDEKHPTNPNSPYGVSKLAAEKYCIAFNEVYGLDVVSLRYFSVYGPRGRPDQVIHAFTSAIVQNKPPVIFGDGMQTRDFTFVNDVVEATVLAAECNEVAGEVFNIGYGKENSIKEVYNMIAGILGSKDETQVEYRKTYKGEFPRTLADNTKARDILGWKPKIKLGQGLKIFVDWFIETGKKDNM